MEKAVNPCLTHLKQVAIAKVRMCKELSILVFNIRAMSVVFLDNRFKGFDMVKGDV